MPVAPYDNSGAVTTTTLQNAAAVTGNGTAIDVTGMTLLMLSLSGTFVATVTFEASVDATSAADGTWVALWGQLTTSPSIALLSTTSGTNYRFTVAGFKFVRARISAYTSGSVTVVGRAQANSAPLPQTNISIYGAGASTSPVVAATAADAVANGVALEALGLSMGYNGATWDRLRTPSVFKVVALTAATAETTIWTPAGGKKFRLMGFVLTCGAASTLTFKDNTAGTTIFAARGATDQAISPSGMGNGILSSAVNQPLTVTRSASATLDGVVWGCEE